jgi:hypothetical protein
VFLAQFASDLLQFRSHRRDEHERMPVPGKLVREMQTDAAGGACDECGFGVHGCICRNISRTRTPLPVGLRLDHGVRTSAQRDPSVAGEGPPLRIIFGLSPAAGAPLLETAVGLFLPAEGNLRANPCEPKRVCLM